MSDEAMKLKCAEFLARAKQELGVSEKSAPRRILSYAKWVSLKVRSVLTPWCSIFANWVVGECGVRGTKSAWARDWLKWGVPLSEPIPGCILVFERNAPGGDSHVTLFSHFDSSGRYMWCLGGNQGNAVSLKLYDKRTLLGMRGPKL